MVVAGSTVVQEAIDAALAEVQASTDVLPYTQLCTVDANATTSYADLDVIKGESTILRCPTGRTSTSAPVAAIGPGGAGLGAGGTGTSSDDFLDWSYSSGLPALTFDVTEEFPDEYAAVRVSPSDSDYAGAVASVLNYFGWTNVVVLYSEAFSTIAELTSETASSIEKREVTDTEPMTELLQEYAEDGFRVFVLLAGDQDTASWLGVAKNESRLEGYGYISVSASASLAVAGAIYVADPVDSAAYARDAVWTLAYGVHNLIESWQAGGEGDEGIAALLSSSSTLLAEFLAVSFYSNATGQDVAFTSSSERECALRVHSVSAVNVSEEVAAWDADGLVFSNGIEIWPGNATEQPLGDHNCEAGAYFSTEVNACISCEAGTYRLASDTTIYSCTDCGEYWVSISPPTPPSDSSTHLDRCYLGALTLSTLFNTKCRVPTPVSVRCSALFVVLASIRAATERPTATNVPPAFIWRMTRSRTRSCMTNSLIVRRVPPVTSVLMRGRRSVSAALPTTTQRRVNARVSFVSAATTGTIWTRVAHALAVPSASEATTCQSRSQGTG